MMFLTLGPSSLLKNPRKFIFLCTFMLLLNGCFKESPVSPESTGVVKLEKQQIQSLCGWQKEDFKNVIDVFKKNCGKILNNRNEYIYNAVIKIKTKEFQNVCQKFMNKKINSAAEMKKFLEKEFDVYAVSDNENYEGKFTSYYEAVIHASFEKTAKY